MDSNGILRGSYWDFNRIHQWSNEKTLVDGLKNWDLYYLILSYVKCWDPFDVKGDSFFYRRGQWQLGTGGNRLPVAMIRHNFHHESYRKDKIYDDKKLPLFILHKLPNNASKISNSQSF